MPIIPTGKRILVTGANGYIGTWLVKSLLSQNYAVRGVVRSPDKAKMLERLFRRYEGRFECVVVEDIVKAGAFDKAVKDIDAIEHTASPVAPVSDDPDHYIKPAIGGTLSILNSALKHGTDIKRIILTSSTAAVVRPVSQYTVLTEEDWNETAVKEVEEKGRLAPDGVKYVASKTLAERAAWDFYRNVKPEVKWDFTSIVPCTVYGPTLLSPTTPAELNTSLTWFYNALVQPTWKSPSEIQTAGSWVDVRDVALAHVLALQKESVREERVLVCAGSESWNGWITVANSLTPAPPLTNPLPKPFAGLEKKQLIKFDTTKSETLLGLRYRSIEETARDVLFDFVSRGW